MHQAGQLPALGRLSGATRSSAASGTSPATPSSPTSTPSPTPNYFKPNGAATTWPPRTVKMALLIPRARVRRPLQARPIRGPGTPTAQEAQRNAGVGHGTNGQPTLLAGRRLVLPLARRLQRFGPAVSWNVPKGVLTIVHGFRRQNRPVVLSSKHVP